MSLSTTNQILPDFVQINLDAFEDPNFDGGDRTSLEKIVKEWAKSHNFEVKSMKLKKI